MRRGWLSLFSMLVIGCICLAEPLRAQFAYEANASSSNVWGYSIGANGALTPIPGSPFAGGIACFSMALDPAGKFAYVLNGASATAPFNGNVSAYSIGANGALTQLTSLGSPFAAGNNPVSVAVDPTGKFVYVANGDDNTVSAYSIAASGALTPVAGSPFAAGNLPVGLAVEPTGKFAYVANGDDNNVWAYSIGVNGALTPTGPHFATGLFPFSVAIDPTGKFVYVANNNGNSVSAYSIGAGGALTQLQSLGSPYAAGAIPRSIVITPVVPFASSFAKLTIAKQGFVLGELFTLGATSNGINPLTESLTLQIGTFSVTIPPGSFKQIALRIFVFQGVLNGVDLRVQIVALGNNIFRLAAESKGVNLTGLTNPVTVVLTVGTNRGSTDVTAQKVEKKERE